MSSSKSLRTIVWTAVAAWSVVSAAGVVAAQTSGSPGLAGLLPKPAEWTMTEAVQRFLPDSLFEYINGAAESYIGYDFRELVVGQYKTKDGPATATIEIYDMGSPRNAFGIYGSERYSESRFEPIGVQGYLEDGTLNFLAGRYYVKLLCFEGGEATDGHLRRFAAEILKSVKDVGGFPAELAAFPREGLVANTEKYIRADVLGFKFLSNGFLAAYKSGGQEFEAFIIEGRSAENAAGMLDQVVERLSKAGGAAPVRSESGVRLKDPYLANVLIAQTGRFLCGAIKIKDGGEAAGEACVAALLRALSGR